MDFPVPQFIEEAPKIVGPLTWRQFLFIGGGAGLIFFFYIVIQNIFLFIFTVVVIVGVASSLAFLKIEGRPFPTVLVNLIFYSASTKLFIWQRKMGKPRIALRREIVHIGKEELEQRGLLGIAPTSKLKNLAKQLETRTK